MRRRGLGYSQDEHAQRADKLLRAIPTARDAGFGELFSGKCSDALISYGAARGILGRAIAHIDAAADRSFTQRSNAEAMELEKLREGIEQRCFLESKREGGGGLVYVGMERKARGR